MGESTVMKVQLETADGENKTLTFDFPQSDLTLTQIRTAFSTLLANGWLLNASGSAAFSQVSKADYVTTTPITD